MTIALSHRLHDTLLSHFRCTLDDTITKGMRCTFLEAGVKEGRIERSKLKTRSRVARRVGHLTSPDHLSSPPQRSNVRTHGKVSRMMEEMKLKLILG